MAITPETMDAIEIDRPGGPEVLTLRKLRTPAPLGTQILIQVKAAGVNRPDILQRQGLYPPPADASPLPGLEVSGIVEKIGNGVKRFEVGEPVCALVAGGGYAEYCIADQGSVLPKPDSLSFVEAAAVPETYFTVWHNVFERGGLTMGETLLVHGGASGIGTTAIQLARAFGARVIATARTDEKCEKCRALGADVAINYNKEDFVAAVERATDGRGADVILDMVGGDYIERNYQAAAEEGRIVQIAFLNGATADVNFTQLMVKRLTHTGSTLRSRSLQVKAGIATALRQTVWPLLENGRVTPVIDSTFPLAEAKAAHLRLEHADHFGKVVLLCE